MFDPNKTITLIKGGLLEPGPTWEEYLQEGRSWQETATLLTGPLIVVTVVVSALLGWLFGSSYLLGHRAGVGGLVLGLVSAAIGLAAAAFVFSFFAGVFKGRHDFNQGLAAVSFAAIPAYAGVILGTLPWIGWLISLALSIVGLVFLYQIIPSYLGVPEDKRAPHYAVSLIATILVVLVINLALGFGAYSTGTFDTGDETGDYGMFGDLGRQAKLIEDAEDDTFDAPADGKISNAQMSAFVDVMRKLAELRGREQERIKQLETQMEGKEEPGLADLGTLTSGLGAAVRSLATAEMEVVKSGGGNWAEHQWVRNQLRIASIQKDINEAVSHNYALYQEYAAQLQQYGFAY